MVDKSVMLIGTALLLSAGMARYWLLGRSTRAATLVGFGGLAALLLFSVVDLRATLLSVIPSADGALLWRYFTTTNHGSAVQARVVFGVVLAGLLWPGRVSAATTVGGTASGVPAARWPGGHVAAPASREPAAALAFLAGSVGLLSSFSVLSHGAVMAGWWPLVTDLVHFLAAGAWAGGVVALVLADVWRPADRALLEAAVGRLSSVGLGAVLTLSVTGVISALLQAGDSAAFVAATYSLALLVKLGLVITTVVLAALNRFLFLPRLTAGGSAASLRTALRAEAVLLALVLVATGWLTTTAVPHDMTAPGAAGVNLIDNAERLIDYLRR